MTTTIKPKNKTMKYKIANQSVIDLDFDVITEDGGVVSIHHNGENYVSTYYQSRINDNMRNVWEYLSAGKSYTKDWCEDVDEDILLADALSWLVFPAPFSWEYDETIFENINF